MQPSLQPWFIGIWAVVLAVWVVTALRMKPLERRGSKHAEWMQWMALALVIALVTSSGGAILSRRILPQAAWLPYLGLAATAAGCGFAIWARLVLGVNWSVSPTIRQGHALIRRGPYALARHPIYTGLLAGFWGMLLASGRVRVLVATVILTVALTLKTQAEETLMQEQFGEAYTQYRRDVKRLIPFVW